LKNEGFIMKTASLCAAALALCIPCSTVDALPGAEKQVPLVGTVLPNPMPALDFTLTDQNGAPFRMADTRGKVVVMTFIYTHCGDTCPFIAVKVRAARTLLGNDVDQVAFVAVTTDPKRDTVPLLAAYSRALGLSQGWHFLTGTAEAVRAVWHDYGVGVEIEKANGEQNGESDVEGDNPKNGLTAGDLGLAGKLVEQFSGGYEVAHTAPFWIIDRKGTIRVALDASATPADLVADANAFMKGR
jgi:cytochrome oxidase Cu insertion factor (SCO1/SenC/PrrC family)